MTFDPLGAQTVGRRSARLAERKRRGKRNTKLAVAALLGAAVLTAGLLVVAGNGGGHKKPGAAARTQRTMLLQVKGPSGTAVASALLAHDPRTTEGSVVLVPPEVIASVPGSGSLPFGRAITVSAAGSREALADLMGVTVDGSWVLDVATFERLVDQEGGIQANVDVTVLSGRVVVLSPGPQRLDGAHAYAFATYLASGEPEQFRLTRLQAVLDGMVLALPPDPSALLGSLGPGSQSTLPVVALANLLTGLKKDDVAQQLQYRSLPVVKVDTGSDESLFRIDAPGTQSLVDELLAQSVPPGVRSSGNRVLVLNGVGTPGLGEKVREKLVPAGFVFVGSRNAPTFGYDKTEVLVKDATPAGTALGDRVAQALGVPLSSVMTSDQLGTIADVVVIVGRDFKAS